VGVAEATGRERLVVRFHFDDGAHPGVYAALEFRLADGKAGGAGDRLNGRYDFRHPLETDQNQMFRLLGTPEKDKRHVLFEGGTMRRRSRTSKRPWTGSTGIWAPWAGSTI
jgi:hypothetical protein